MHLFFCRGAKIADAFYFFLALIEVGNCYLSINLTSQPFASREKEQLVSAMIAFSLFSWQYVNNSCLTDKLLWFTGRHFRLEPNHFPWNCIPKLATFITNYGIRMQVFPFEIYEEFQINLSIENLSKTVSNIYARMSLHKKWSFLLRISSVNVTKSAVFGWFGHINWN